MVQAHALTREKDAQSPISKTAPLSSQTAETLPDCGILAAARAIAHHAAIHT
jgi:hypothetical protein